MTKVTKNRIQTNVDYDVKGLPESDPNGKSDKGKAEGEEKYCQQ